MGGVVSAGDAIDLCVSSLWYSVNNIHFFLTLSLQCRSPLMTDLRTLNLCALWVRYSREDEESIHSYFSLEPESEDSVLLCVMIDPLL